MLIVLRIKAFYLRFRISSLSLGFGAGLWAGFGAIRPHIPAWLAEFIRQLAAHL